MINRFLAPGVVLMAMASCASAPNINDARRGAPDFSASQVRAIQFAYRDLIPKDPDWRHGCYLKRPKAKAP